MLKSADRAIVGPVDIKCPRCGTMNSLRPLVIEPTEPFSDRHERTETGECSCGSTSRKNASAA
ncbi:Com family DNA-binding transcriptional regulator [Roseibium sp. CAU 1637]|uniref:Com family DNA-binding transcriptional regulator n=1 Tax=Roseibium limicola TaxID=2816037 RepID=A0A939EQ64_9HYPH|nr:Com family DNA-binding transcriptional regulator [Roseibium limicola]